MQCSNVCVVSRAKCHLDESGAKVGSCNHCGAQNWNIVGDTETGLSVCYHGEQRSVINNNCCSQAMC